MVDFEIVIKFEKSIYRMSLTMDKNNEIIAGSLELTNFSFWVNSKKCFTSDDKLIFSLSAKEKK